jgi:carbon starvation protein
VEIAKSASLCRLRVLAVRVWIRALRSPTPLPTTEEPHVESLISAPDGLLGGAGEDRREIAVTGRRAH